MEHFCNSTLFVALLINCVPKVLPSTFQTALLDSLTCLLGNLGGCALPFFRISSYVRFKSASSKVQHFWDASGTFQSVQKCSTFGVPLAQSQHFTAFLGRRSSQTEPNGTNAVSSHNLVLLLFLLHCHTQNKLQQAPKPCKQTLNKSTLSSSSIFPSPREAWREPIDPWWRCNCLPPRVLQ